jgi:hypothetical protein
VADLAAARTREATGLAHGERREVVVEDEALRLRAAGESVHFLGVLGGPEGGDHEALGVSALEERGAVHAGKRADSGRDGAERLCVAAVGADAAGEHGLAVGLVLQVFEDDVEVDVGELALAELGEKGGAGLLLENLHGGAAGGLLLAEDGIGEALGRNDALNDGARLGRRADEREGCLGLAAERDQFLDRADDRLDRLVAELECLDESFLGHLVRGTLDHQHVLLGADVDQVERRGEHLLDRGIRDELALYLGDADAADWAVPRNVGDRERCAGTVDHQDVGLVDLVRREELADDLDLVEEALGEERTAGPVAKARGENLLLGRAAFPLEVTAREAACGRVFLAIVDGQREEVLTGAQCLRDAGGDEDVGFADADIDGAAGELGDGARGERDPKFGDRDVMLLFHVSISCGSVPRTA